MDSVDMQSSLVQEDPSSPSTCKDDESHVYAGSGDRLICPNDGIPLADSLDVVI